MLGDDVKMLARLEPAVRRVLIVDSNLASARLLAELMKGMGGREIVFESDEKAAMDLARDMEPTLAFVERSGPRFDGEELVRKLRRSRLAVRKIPVIMVTAEATASNIWGARDAGVHEFMVKPFSTGDLVRRVINVATKPRPWVEAVGYVGPDRRRFNSGDYSGTRKRQNDGQGRAAALDPMEQATKIIIAALDQFSNDPAQARRALAAQGEILKDLADASGRAPLGAAAAALIAAAQVETAEIDDLRRFAVAALSQATTTSVAGRAA